MGRGIPSVALFIIQRSEAPMSPSGERGACQPAERAASQGLSDGPISGGVWGAGQAVERAGVCTGRTETTKNDQIP